MSETQAVLSLEDVKKEILEFCLQAQSRTEILDYIQVASTTANYSKFIRELLVHRFIRTNLIEKRSSRYEKYVITQKGLNYLKAIAI
ncbi:hypothetical protein AHMF7605_01880 [Adhaeribacter arboris]|uniref:ArnR1-like winged helix-turn-helix domain-containing protein n=1 Tax=Adhaeribacter arboris TaxID=2072846 RepID=A0A2T2YA94_9BACT|nr:hypothetical protein [Adhaeribacter arboris]PSR52358.1 hypothetical protein AHMF7605_01880 [Adhaeribacter arboris]